MSLRYETLHGDLKESFRRSNEFQMGLETIFSKVNGGAYSQKSKAVMQSRQETLERTEALLSLGQKEGKYGGKAGDTQGKLQKTSTVAASVDGSPKTSQAKRGRFRSQIHEFNHRLALIKTGKVHPDFAEDSYVSRILESSGSPTARTGGPSLTNRSFDWGEYRPLPHVSCVSGKTEVPMTLPTYEEYCRTHQLGSVKGSTLKPYLKKVEERIGGLEKMKRRLNGLDILLSSHEQWDGDKELLEKLERHPEHRGAILSSRHVEERTVGTRRITMRRITAIRRSCPRPTNGRVLSHEDAEKLITSCAEQFEASKTHQDQHLDDIVQRMTIEKPFQFRQKAHLFQTDKLSIAHSTQVFYDLRRSIESVRGQRVKQARAQAMVYGEMMKFLQQLDTPSESQLQCLVIVKRILEEGWVITHEVCDQIEQSFEAGDDGVQSLFRVVRESLT